MEAEASDPTPSVVGATAHGGRADILDRVLRRCDRGEWLPPGSRVLVACSGGLDSTALLDVLCRIADRRGITLAVAHLDHAVRASSEEDARFVAEVAGARRLEVFVRRLAPDQLEAGRSPEDALRRARRRWLEHEASRWGAARIAAGHHADDRAEWALLRIFQGAAADSWNIPDARGPWIRPLYDCWRVELEAYARMRGLSWREDETNADTGIPRNWIRHQALPLLETSGAPRLRAALATLAAEAGEDAALLGDLADREWSSAVDEETGTLRAGTLLGMPRALARRVIARWLARVLGLDPRRSSIRVVLSALDHPATNGAIIDLGGGWTLEKRGDHLVPSRRAGSRGSADSVEGAQGF